MKLITSIEKEWQRFQPVFAQRLTGDELLLAKRAFFIGLLRGASRIMERPPEERVEALAIISEESKFLTIE